MSDITNWLAASANAGGYITTSATVSYDKTFAPERFLQGGIGKWVDRSGGIALGYPTVTMGVRPPTKDSRLTKVSMKFFYPVLETVDPATGIFGPKLAYTLQAHVDITVPERATTAEKTAFWNLFRSMLFINIEASDGAPNDASGCPIQAAVLTGEDVF